MRLLRLAPEGFYAVDDGETLRWLHSDPFETPSGSWAFGGEIDRQGAIALVPVAPSKIIGIGRNYREHARELGNPIPVEPLIFLKAPSSLVGPNVPVLLPPESDRVEYEGEIAVVIGKALSRANQQEAEDGILGVTAALDITARDLQRRDATFARGKSFDSFCPLGPAVRLGAECDHLRLTTRVNGTVRQQGAVADMIFPPGELVAYVSHCMSLEPGDIILTGTPEGVGPLAAGDQIEVEVDEVGTLSTPVHRLRPAVGGE